MKIIVTISTHILLFEDNRYHRFYLRIVFCLKIIVTMQLRRSILLCLKIIVTISTYSLLFKDNRYHTATYSILFCLKIIVTVSTHIFLFEDNGYHVYV